MKTAKFFEKILEVISFIVYLCMTIGASIIIAFALIAACVMMMPFATIHTSITEKVSLPIALGLEITEMLECLKELIDELGF